MDFTHTLNYPIPADDLVNILANSDFLRHRFTQAGATATIDAPQPDESGVRTVRSTVTVPADRLPSGMRRFVPAELQVKITEIFTPTDAGTWTIATEASLVALPVTAHATSTLTTHGNESVRTASGTLSVNIPFFGRKIEAIAVDNIDKAAEAEVASVKSWLGLL